MKKIQKHAFESVSLLTLENGVLELAIIPAVNQPDWLVPKRLILTILDFQERIWTYLWQGQEISVYHLIPREVNADKLVILEGNSQVHRLALQTTGELRYVSVRISDVKDKPLDLTVRAQMIEKIPSLFDQSDNKLEYVYETVEIQGVTYIVPDLDLIVHRLVDLDS